MKLSIFLANIISNIQFECGDDTCWNNFIFRYDCMCGKNLAYQT